MSKMGKIKKTENKRIIEEDYSDEFSFTKFISIVLIIMIVLGVFFIITVFVAKDKTKEKTDSNNAVINTDMVTISNMLSKKESDYYVLAFKFENGKKSNLDIYNAYIKDIKNNDESFTIYKVNLGDAINKSYIGENNNLTSNLSEFKIKDEVLMHIVDNEIEETYIGLDNISSKLKELKGE